MDLSNKTYDRWTDEEVQVLLCIYAEEDIQREFKSATRNYKVYGKICARLRERNIEHTVKQVREKLKKLKQDYKKIKDHNRRSGTNRRTSKWYDLLDTVLGHRPPFSGLKVTEDSATVLPDAMCKNLSEMDPQSEGERERERDKFFLEALREMEEANCAILRQANEQRERYMQLLLQAQVQELELRRQELELLQADAAERRRLQRDFQIGFLAVLGQLVNSLSQKKPADSPLD